MFNFPFFAAFGAGILSFLSPCILPLIPSYISFITGISITQLTQNSENLPLKRKILLSSVLFILGFSMVFIGLGASASFMGQLLQHYQQWISRIGGVFIVIMGFYLMGLLKIPFLNREKKIHLTQNSMGYWGTPLVGAVFAAGWTPCVGPILGSILFYASASASMGKGIILLSLYSAGLAVPFLIASLALGIFLQRYLKFKKYMRLISLVSGALLITMGILLISNLFPFLGFGFSFSF